jgi:hypothetical protein
VLWSKRRLGSASVCYMGHDCLWRSRRRTSESVGTAVRQERFSEFIRHFRDYPKEVIKDLGENLSVAHGLASRNSHRAQAAAMNNVSIDRFLWRDGIAAEELMPRQHRSVEAFRDLMRHLFADWADLDMVAAHYAYGFDLMCTEDNGNP